MGDLPTHVHRCLTSWATCPSTHIDLFSRATYPHMLIQVYFQGRPAHMVYFHGRPALPLILIYFHGRPTHTCSSWSIFRGDRPTWFIFTGDLPTHAHPGLFSRATGPHGLFSWATCPSTHTILFSRATYPHMLILVYFQGQPAHTSSWSIFRGDRPTWSIFMGDLPFHSH